MKFVTSTNCKYPAVVENCQYGCSNTSPKVCEKCVTSLVTKMINENREECLECDIVVKSIPPPPSPPLPH